jgi:hypothetical protein
VTTWLIFVATWVVLGILAARREVRMQRLDPDRGHWTDCNTGQTWRVPDDRYCTCPGRTIRVLGLLLAGPLGVAGIGISWLLIVGQPPQALTAAEQELLARRIDRLEREAGIA